MIQIQSVSTNSTNREPISICSVISQICEDPAMILPRSSVRSAGSFSGTAANVVAFGRGDLGTRVRFVTLVLVTI